MVFGLVLLSVGLNSGEVGEIYNLPQCYGDVDVRIRGVNDVLNYNEYAIIECEYARDLSQKEHLLKCPCKRSSSSLFLQTLPSTNNTYDFVIQYNVLPDISDSNGIRTINVNNVDVRVPPPPKPGPVRLPEGGEWIVIVIGVIGAIIIIITIFYIRKLFFGEPEEAEFTDAEINDFIRRI